MESNDYPRMDGADDPDRCQALTTEDQCNLKRFGESLYCKVHGGNVANQKIRDASLTAYRQSKWQARIQAHGEHPRVKSLRDEIGILRILMEERLETVHTPFDFIAAAGPISDIVDKIARTVQAADKLEKSMGEHLDKQALLTFGSEVIGIIANNIKDTDVVDKIANEIMQAIPGSNDE